MVPDLGWRLQIYERDRPVKVSIVLVAEDDVSLRVSITLLLQSLGCEVHACSDGHSAALWMKEWMRTADIGKRVCILTDLEMSPGDGLELLSELKALERQWTAKWGTDHTPWVTIVTSAREGGERLAIQAGADLFLKKPFVPSALIECVPKAFVRLNSTQIVKN